MRVSRVSSLAALILASNLVTGCGSDSSGGEVPIADSAGDNVSATAMAAAATEVEMSPNPAAIDSSADTAAADPGGDEPDPRPSSKALAAGTRQFASGFEAGVSLPATSTRGNSDQYPQGGDASGYRFPLDLWSTPTQWRTWLLSVVGASTPLPASSYATGEIMTVTGHGGGSTRALALVSKAKSPSTDSQQVALQNYRPGVEPVMYQRMWVKFDQNTLSRARSVGTNFWQIFWEVKASPDYRLRLQLRYADGNLYWHTQGDVLSNAQPLWQASLKSAPVVMAADSSAGGWHKVEVWMNRPGGQFKVFIDGQRLIDYNGRLMGSSGSRVDQFKMAMVYSTVSPLTKTLFDDLEFWSAPPADAWRK